MLFNQFIIQNFHFALNLIAALIFFTVFWLHFDAWLVKKSFKDSLKFLGFFLISLSFFSHSVLMEQRLLLEHVIQPQILSLITTYLRLFGYLSLIIALIIDPLMKRPYSPGLKMESVSALFLVTGFFNNNLVADSCFVLPILASLVALLYLRKATLGFENQFKKVSFSFFVLSLAELISLSSLFRETGNINLYNLTASFGPLWFMQHCLLLIAILSLGSWSWRYLLKRFQNQLFIIFITSVVMIFLITTLTFTFLLLKNLENDTLRHLETDVNVLAYSLDSKKAETLSDAELVSQNQEIKKALQDKNKRKLKELVSTILLTKKEASLILTDENGVVYARAEDPERIGDSISSDKLIKRALNDESLSSVVTNEGVLAPIVSVRSIAPIKENDKIIGTILVSKNIDDAFVDGLKEATKLDITIFADNVRSATTFIAPDAKSRFLGIKEESKIIKKKVLQEGKIYRGQTIILSVPYYAVYSPLKDLDNNPIGMLFVGSEQSSIIQTASKSIEFTFLLATILIVLSIIPAYLVAENISSQIR